jgi:hypothetical protein
MFPGVFVSGVYRSEMNKKRWELDAPGDFVVEIQMAINANIDI